MMQAFAGQSGSCAVRKRTDTQEMSGAKIEKDYAVKLQHTSRTKDTFHSLSKRSKWRKRKRSDAPFLKFIEMELCSKYVFISFQENMQLLKLLSS